MNEKLREKIAFEVYRSKPSCGMKKECNTECGTCGADRILPLICKEIEGTENPYHQTADYGHGEELWNKQPHFGIFEKAVQAILDKIRGKE